MTEQIQTPAKTYCGFIAIVGRPNVGKSTLLNKILGQKISITSRKAQTTRHRIVGIHTEDQYQAIYVDTPGLHIEEKRAINRLMNRAASSAIGDVDLIIFVVEGTKWTEDDEMVLNKLRSAKAPVLLAINKIDNIKEKKNFCRILPSFHKNLILLKFCQFRHNGVKMCIFYRNLSVNHCVKVSTTFLKSM